MYIYIYTIGQRYQQQNEYTNEVIDKYLTNMNLHIQNESIENETKEDNNTNDGT